MKNIIEAAWKNKSLLENEETKQAIRSVIEDLDNGALRVAEPMNDGWIVNEWIKKAVVLYFPIQKMETMEVGPIEFHDKIPLGHETIYEHLLYINANSFTPVDETLIPTGDIKLLTNSPFDFTIPTKIGKRINQDNSQLNYGKGYDHNYVLNNSQSEKIIASKVFEKKSGRVMEVYTNEPGIQFYSGNFLSRTIGKHYKTYKKRSAFCLETQHFPNSPNQDNFPNTLLKPNEEYYSICIYKFSTN